MVTADVICLDADYTLIQYKVSEFLQLQYRSLAKCIRKFGYNDSILNPPWLDQMSKNYYNGSVADFETGYILKLASDNTILRAYFGLDEVSQEDLCEKYGNPPMYQLDQIEFAFIKNKRFLFVTQFYGGGGYVFMSGIELSKRGLMEIGTYKDWGEKVYIASNINYDPTIRSDYCSEFYPEFYTDPGRYVTVQSDEVKTELRSLKSAGKKIVMITNSCIEYTSTVFEFAFGADWRSYFDLIVSSAGKPLFYMTDKQFQRLEDHQNHMVRGNHKELMRLTGCGEYVFIGDHYIGDCIFPKNYAGWNVVFLMEEVYNEKGFVGAAGVEEIEGRESCHIDGDVLDYHEKWGSAFMDQGKRTFWWDHVARSSSIISSSLLGCLRAIQ